MRLDTPEIAWHGKEPILSVDFSKIGSTWRLASAGADNDVKVRSKNVQSLFHKIDVISALLDAFLILIFFVFPHRSGL